LLHRHKLRLRQISPFEAIDLAAGIALVISNSGSAKLPPKRELGGRSVRHSLPLIPPRDAAADIRCQVFLFWTTEIKRYKKKAETKGPRSLAQRAHWDRS
jgi:hypothetical protein